MTQRNARGCDNALVGSLEFLLPRHVELCHETLVLVKSVLKRLKIRS
jgi:hypothetical protein